MFNVGSDDQNYTMLQAGELIQALIPEAQLTLQDDETDVRNYRVSFAKIGRELGFKSLHTVADGVREIEAALREGQIEDYGAKRYSNYKTLNETYNGLGIGSRQISELYAAPRPAAAADGAATANLSGA